MIQSDQPLSYTLPLPEGAVNGDDLVFAPYWRFKGVVYAMNEDEVSHRIVDMTSRAATTDVLPFSLGMRPQALKLRLSIARPPSRSLAMGTDHGQFLKLVRHDGKGQKNVFADRFSYRTAVGEVVSLLHAPFLLRDGALHDPYTGRALPAGSGVESGLTVIETEPPNGVRFQPTVCPNCGWDMEGSADSHVLFCRSCQSSWEAVGREFHRLEPQLIPSVEPVDIWLPFWRIELSTTGFDLATYDDFVRLTNVPKVIGSAMGSRPFSFWVPAFKIQPKLFLRLSGVFTLAQPSGEDMPLPEISSLYPCTLPAVAGFQSVPIVLGAIAPAKRDLLPKIKRGRFAFQGKQLIWVPFQNRGVECIQPQMEFSIPRDSLRWGRVL